MLRDRLFKLMGMGLLMDEKKEGGDGGGGAPPKAPEGNGSVTLSKEQFDALMAKFNSKEPEKKEDPGLADKVKKENEEKAIGAAREKSLESAIHFAHASKDFVKANKGLLPETIEGIFSQAEKENYTSAIEKANAVKSEIVKEFFAVQSNLDLLTGSQKNQLAEYLKLTKTERQDRVENVYSMIFEPTLETLRKVEKAKQLNSGGKDQTDDEKVYVQRMIKQSKKHYLGEKDA